jgi:hypothetical protein
MFIATAPMVLNIGHIPQKRLSPKRETIEKTTASGRHKSEGRTTPRKLREESTNPITASVHTIFAMTLIVVAGSLGKSQERAGMK